MGNLEEVFGTHFVRCKLLVLVLLGVWMEELRVHPHGRQVAEVRRLLGEVLPGNYRHREGRWRLERLSRLLPGYRPWLRYGLLGFL